MHKTKQEQMKPIKLDEQHMPHHPASKLDWQSFRAGFEHGYRIPKGWLMRNNNTEDLAWRLWVTLKSGK